MRWDGADRGVPHRWFVDVGHPQFGRSLLPVLRDGSAPHRDVAFSEGGFRLDEAQQGEQMAQGHYALKTALLHERPELVGRAVAMRTPGWTYVYRLGDADELYDRVADPQETTNLACRADHAPTIAALRTQVLDWMVATSDVIPYERDPRMDPALLANAFPDLADLIGGGTADRPAAAP